MDWAQRDNGSSGADGQLAAGMHCYGQLQPGGCTSECDRDGQGRPDGRSAHPDGGRYNDKALPVADNAGVPDGHGIGGCACDAGRAEV